MRENSMRQRRTKRVSYRNVNNLCPNCFSTLISEDTGNFYCSGDRIASWQKEIEDYKNMSEEEQQAYLKTLSNPSKFLELIVSFDTLDCGTSTQLSNISTHNNIRIPDPMAVGKIEKLLKRSLTEEELEEGYEFKINTKAYTLPFISFPEDL